MKTISYLIQVVILLVAQENQPLNKHLQIYCSQETNKLLHINNQLDSNLNKQLSTRQLLIKLSLSCHRLSRFLNLSVTIQLKFSLNKRLGYREVKRLKLVKIITLVVLELHLLEKLNPLDQEVMDNLLLKQALLAFQVTIYMDRRLSFRNIYLIIQDFRTFLTHRLLKLKKT